MDELIDEFIAETREMLDALGGEVVAWEAEPENRARLDAIFRFVHTVKGNSGFFDLPRLQRLSHAAEDVLAEVRAGKRQPDRRLVSAVLGVIDRIGDLVAGLESHADPGSPEEDEGLIAALRAQAPPQGEERRAIVRADGEHVGKRSIRLPVDLLDRMMSGVSDLVLARNEFCRRLRLNAASAELIPGFDGLSAAIAEMRDVITRTRMQRIDLLFAPLPRMVRDLAAETGKDVRLEIEGRDVELDREMIELIRDPLSHIVRNAIGHGLESPAERATAGKSTSGLVRISARQSGNQIAIEIRDDGRGIDGEALVKKALSLGLLTQEAAASLGPSERAALIFEPGLSTASEVTAISGRGVGMDVVRANIERIGGVVDIGGQGGSGTRITLRVPLTLTIIPALGVSAAGGHYALPRSAIEEIVRLRPGAAAIEHVGGARFVTIRSRRIPLVSLAETIGAAAADGPGECDLVLLRPAGGALYVLGVDAVHDHEDLVIKPAAPAVMATGFYAGTTIADDGSPVLLLDPPGIAAAAGIGSDAVESAVDFPVAHSNADSTTMVLFRTRLGARRMAPLSAVERIEDVPPEHIGESGGRRHVTLDERILPLAGIGDESIDAPIRILRLTDGVSQLAFGFGEVIDIVRVGAAEVAAARPAPRPGEVVSIALVGGEQVEILDLHFLFSALGTGAGAAAPSCALEAGDPWMQTFLRPIVEAAGYRVVDASDIGTADLHIISEGEAPPADLPASRTLRLRGDPEPAGRGDRSIYRYDRSALIAALSRRAGKSGGAR